jgi:hypothetical protein
MFSMHDKVRPINLLCSMEYCAYGERGDTRIETDVCWIVKLLFNSKWHTISWHHCVLSFLWYVSHLNNTSQQKKKKKTFVLSYLTVFSASINTLGRRDRRMVRRCCLRTESQSVWNYNMHWINSIQFSHNGMHTLKNNLSHQAYIMAKLVKNLLTG